ncbi:hypothetical protein [Clostridium acidisoli]|uniref:hypothetical protein n=1 Tax=Clostridium acidisoli TaxID=91624 RepID=UPI001FA89791|nr:hypothetical protein [Clostridium acidisoli]
MSQEEKIAKEILNNLPDWFGLPESTKKYIQQSKDLHFWADVKDELARGFAVLKNYIEKNWQESVSTLL